MERSFLAGLSSGDDRSWLPLPSTVELRGFPRTGSRASSSVAQLNSASLGTRSWFELCPAMGRGETQPGRNPARCFRHHQRQGGSRDGNCCFWVSATILHCVLQQKPSSSSPSEREHHAAAGAACLAFQVSDLPTVLSEEVAIVTMCSHLPFAHQQWWSLQSR